VDRHLPRIISSNDILHTLTVRKHIVCPADTFAHGEDIEIVAEEVKVDVSLLQRIGRVQLDLSFGERAKQIDNDREAITL
jgi:hypothetical protein